MKNMKEKNAIVPIAVKVDNIGNLIYTIREKQVMPDHDLAALYGYEVRVLNQQVKRNIGRKDHLSYRSFNKGRREEVFLYFPDK